MRQRHLTLLTYGSSLLMLSLMSVALYNEQFYLTTTELIHVNDSTVHQMSWTVIVAQLFFLSTTLAIANVDKYVKFLMLAVNHGTILVFQFGMLFHGLVVIDRQIGEFIRHWSQLRYSPVIASVEEKLACCGFYDTAMSVVLDCNHSVPCEPKIMGVRYSRVVSFMALTCCSLVLQVFHAFAIWSMKPLAVAKGAEFDDLIVTKIDDEENM